MSETNTPEYKTFFRNQAKIADTIGDINGLIDRIVAELYAKKIVGKAVRDAANIHGPQVPEIKRVEPVLKAILKKIELNKDVYYKVRGVMLSSEPGLEQLLPKKLPTEDESEDEDDPDTPSGTPLSTRTTNVPKHAKTSISEHGTRSCWPCGCYIFIVATAVALAVVAVVYVNNGIPGIQDVVPMSIKPGDPVPVSSKPKDTITTAAGGCQSISNKRELEKAVAEIGDWESLCENLGAPKAVISELRSSSMQDGKKKSRCLEAYVDTDEACWEQVVKVVADYPFHNKRLARQIADNHGIHYSSREEL